MNYTVLVVDDEQEQRRALIEKVQWAAAGFEVVGEAENGVEALDLVETLEPDLILTDIRMPMITGLELAARVRQLRPATQMVILSGYDSFEYARTAIDYNIIRYLLKPISSAEMSQELFDIHRRMDERVGNMLAQPDPDVTRQLHRAQVEEFLMPLMLGSNEERPEDAALLEEARRLELLPADRTEFRFCVLVSKFRDAAGSYVTERSHSEFIGKVMERYFPSETFVVYGRAVTLVVVPAAGKLSNQLELPLRELVQTARRMLRQHCTVGVSREFNQLSYCSDAYFQAITARRYTSDGAGEVRFINDQERDVELEIDRAEKMAATLEQLLKVGDADALTVFINELYETSTPENANLLVTQIIATVYRVVSAVSDKAALSRLLSSNPIVSRITSYTSEGAVRQELIHFCNDAKTIIAQSQRRDSEVLCDRVVEIIDRQYADETLSLTGVSNMLAVSPNYLSTLIKKTKKKNFVALLTERRMKAAHDMIVCSGMKMLEIAEKCGYSDQHYFSYCFKKFYGESPNKVRSQSRGEDV